MASDLNQCNFIGRLGADPEARYTADGNAVVNFRIAVNWKSKDKEGAEWVPCAAFGKLAEIIIEYLKKGAPVFVSGRFRTRKWQTDKGEDRYMTEIVVDQMQMLGKAPERSEAEQDDRDHEQRPARPATAAAYQSKKDGNTVAGTDDIPF